MIFFVKTLILVSTIVCFQVCHLYALKNFPRGKILNFFLHAPLTKVFEKLKKACKFFTKRHLFADEFNILSTFIPFYPLSSSFNPLSSFNPFSSHFLSTFLFILSTFIHFLSIFYPLSSHFHGLKSFVITFTPFSWFIIVS